MVSLCADDPAQCREQYGGFVEGVVTPRNEGKRNKALQAFFGLWAGADSCASKIAACRVFDAVCSLGQKGLRLKKLPVHKTAKKYLQIRPGDFWPLVLHNLAIVSVTKNDAAYNFL